MIWYLFSGYRKCFTKTDINFREIAHRKNIHVTHPRRIFNKSTVTTFADTRSLRGKAGAVHSCYKLTRSWYSRLIEWDGEVEMRCAGSGGTAADRAGLAGTRLPEMRHPVRAAFVKKGQPEAAMKPSYFNGLVLALPRTRCHARPVSQVMRRRLDPKSSGRSSSVQGRH